jgi:hypothetical protein
MNNNKSCEYIFNKNKIKSMSIFRLFTESISNHNMNDICDKIYNDITFDEKQYNGLLVPLYYHNGSPSAQWLCCKCGKYIS